MSRCTGPDCGHSSHGGNPEELPDTRRARGAPMVIEGNGLSPSETTATQPEPEKVEGPSWATFTSKDRIPIKGYWFRVRGYSKDWELVLECLGPTRKSGKVK